LDIFKDAPFEVSDWIEENNKNTWVSRVIKLWFTMHKELGKLDYAQWPQILDDQPFFDKSTAHLNKVIKEVADYVEFEPVHFDFTPEVLMKLHYLQIHIGGVDNLNP
jgi:hypothetical protein